MANITRYSSTPPVGDWMEDMFKGFLMRPPRLFEGELGMSIKADVSENDKDYTVKAEMPGVKKEDIKVTIDGNQVTISAEAKKEHEEKKGEKVIRCERYYGQVYRSMSLDSEVDPDKAEAKFDNGVLTLTLPKKAGTAGKQLTVS